MASHPLPLDRQYRAEFVAAVLVISVAAIGTWVLPTSPFAVRRGTNCGGSAAESAAMANLMLARTAIEFYREEHGGAYPDFEGKQWTELIGTYVRSAPMNPRTRSAAIIVSDAPAMSLDSGWVWNSASHEISLAGFDEGARAFVGGR